MIVFFSWLRNRAIFRYAKDLPFALAKDYGKSNFYFPAQVESTIKRQRLSTRYTAFALVMFCSNETYVKAQSEVKFDLDYEEGRLLIGKVLFRDCSDFTQDDISKGFSENNVGGDDAGSE